MTSSGLAVYVCLFLVLFAGGCHGRAPDISSCVEGFTAGDMYGGEERFIQANEYKSTCEQTCKDLHPDSIGVTESLKQKYSSGTGRNKNKCWCEFGIPKLDESNKNYQTCILGCPIPAPAPLSASESEFWHQGSFVCSGHADPFYNIPKTSEDIAIQLLAKGGVIENGELVIKEELIIPRTDPKSSVCHLICPPGYEPRRSSTSCSSGDWTDDPKNMFCVSSLCGALTAPEHGKFDCYGTPSTCYLTCDPGYATMSDTKITCDNSQWNMKQGMKCEVAVALMIGGIGHSAYGFFPEQCQTAEVFSPVDEACSAPKKLPPLKIGVTHHTTHLLNGEILICGGTDCGRIAEEIASESTKQPVYTATKSSQSCFKMLENNTWAFHSSLPGHEYVRYHLGAIQQGKLQLVGGLRREDDSILELNGNNWSLGRKPSLPPAAAMLGQNCLVVTSPITFVVIGGSYNTIKKKNDQRSTVLEFNSLTEEWTELPDIPEGRHDHACALVTTSSGPGIMVAGGNNRDISKDQLESVYLLDLGTKMWYPAGNLTIGRENMELVVLGEKVMVLGSYYFNKNGHTSEEETVEEYVVPCPSLRECSPSQEGTWTPTQRIINRRKLGSVLPVPASRFGCTG